MMLALTRSTRAAHILSLQARALSTITHSTGSPNTDAEQSGNDPAPAKTPRELQIHVANSSAESMLVFPWNGIRSSAEGLAIAQAVQDKYGRAKEVFFPRNLDSVNIFQPYFWLIFDNHDLDKRLPEESAQITLHVADLPRGDGNVSLEEMIRGLGSDNNDPHHSSPPPTETDASKNASDAPPEGYKAIEVRVERAQYFPHEFLRRKSVFGDQRPGFAKAWLAFDGFSSESARGPQTPNLFRAREKWRKRAPLAPTREDGDDHATAAAHAVSPSSQGIDVEGVEAGTEPMTETRTNEIREWVPIIPSTLYSQQRRGSDSATSKNIRFQEALDTTIPTNPHNTPFNAASATSAAKAAVADTTTDATATAMPAGTEEETAAKQAQAQAGAAKLSRRERILDLARQNARTPLPKLPEKPQPPPETEKIDEESERQGKERTIRERLWRLVGGNY